jgi:hypothetical protein
MKVLIINLLFLIAVYNGEAQSFKAGFQFGMTGTQVTGDNLSGYKKLGVYGGIFVNRPISERSSFQLEMSFIQKGSRQNVDPNSDNPSSYLMRLNYLEMPILYRKKIKNRFWFDSGVSFGYLIKSSEYEDGYLFETQGLPEFKKYEIAGIVGLNYNINENLHFCFRFSYSILSIRPQAVGYHAHINGGQYNDVLCSSFQYMF